MEKRNTAKEKKKRNKGYPYKHGGHSRCEKKSFSHTLLQVIEDWNIKIKEFQLRMLQKKIDKSIGKEEKIKENI